VSVALPSYVSVPGSQSLGWSLSGEIRIKMTIGIEAHIQGWKLYGSETHSGPPFPPDRICRVLMDWPGGTGELIQEIHDTIYDPIPWSDWIGFTETGSGFRLGRRYDLIDGAPTPSFGQRDREENNTLFSDASSQIVQSMGGKTYTGTFTDPPTSAGRCQGACRLSAANYYPFSGQTGASVQFRNLVLTDWDASTMTELDNGILRGTGSGGCELYVINTVVPAGEVLFAPALKWTEDGAVSFFGQSAPNVIRLVDRFQCQGTVPIPYVTYPSANGSYTAQLCSWPLARRTFGLFGAGFAISSVPLSWTVQSAWAAAQDPPLMEGDKYVGIHGHNGLDAPGSPSTYQPVGIDFPNTVDVHRPDGNKPSSWVVNSGAGSVADGATNVVFTVVNAGDSFKRTLSTGWRGRADKRDVRHHAPEDVFWLPSYGFLKQTWNASAACGIVLEARGVHLEVPGGEHPFTIDYPASLASGAHDLLIDLIAGSGSETYPTRVDEWQLTFDTPGTYTLSAGVLYGRTDLASPGGAVYAKVLQCHPNNGVDYNMIVLSRDGASILDCLPPIVHTGNESIPEVYGGAVTQITGDMLSLSDAWLESGPNDGVGKIEGVGTPTYSAGAYEAVNKDAYSTYYGPERADWLLPNPPYDLVAPGATWQPLAAPLIARLRLTNLVTNKALIRWHIWGALEAVAISGSARDAGASVPIYRDDTGALLATGTADALGYTVISPLPTNGFLVLRGAP
jgi:hypothetical protein